MGNELQTIANAALPANMPPTATVFTGDKQTVFGNAEKVEIHNHFSLPIAPSSETTIAPIYFFAGESVSAKIDKQPNALSKEHYGLFVTYDETFKGGRFTISSDRVNVEVFQGERAGRYTELTAETIEKVKNLSSLFMAENNEYGGVASENQIVYLGVVTNIRQFNSDTIVSFTKLGEIPQQKINEIAVYLSIYNKGTGVTELNHTHFVVKEVNLINELVLAGIMPTDKKEIGSVQTDYIQAATARFALVKTLLFSENAVSLRDFYTPTALKYDALEGKKRSTVTAKSVSLNYFTEDYLRKTIVKAVGGMGKTLFLRSLALTAFAEYNDTSHLPIYIRLQDYAHNIDMSFLNFVHKQTLVDGVGTLKYETFLDFLKAGRCALLLDGLDEIPKQEIRRFDGALREFCAEYSKNVYIVASRPFNMYKLAALEGFVTMDLQPLKYDEAVELLRKMEAQQTKKGARTFSKDLTRELFQRHESFMKNPLLLTAMLKTYNRLNGIPDKTHILYREVVNSLTELYDDTSGNEKRMLKTKLSVSEILDIFGALCFQAYEDEESTFSEVKIDAYLRNWGMDIDISALLFDLCDNICLLENVSGTYRFMHRSMQEYFCAERLSKLPPKDLERAIYALDRREQSKGGTPLSFLCDISMEFTERYIFLPFLGSLIGNAKRYGGYYKYLTEQYPMIYYNSGDNEGEAENTPISPIIGFILERINFKYDLDVTNFEFYEDLATEVTLFPIFDFGSDGEEEFNEDCDDESTLLPFGMVVVEAVSDGDQTSAFVWPDKAGEVPVPITVPISEYDPDAGDIVYDESGYNLEFSPAKIYESYEIDGKYGGIVKVLDDDRFAFKAEYLAVYDYYQQLRERYKS